MNSYLRHLGIILGLIVAFTIFPKPSSAQQEEVSFQVFYDELSPYGDWIDYQNYGYAWIPNVGSDFVPYSTAGYWLFTDYGWTWMSDYEWGWAPFHYGRWDYTNAYGWLWIPDNIWGPSWVNWRRADGYYGWSPMEPGISINLSFGRQYNRNNDHWMFVRDRDFERHDLNRYSVNRSNHETIFRNSTVISTTHIDNNRHTTYVTGPSREDVQRVSGQGINPVTIRENKRPGQVMSNGQLQIYRPQIGKNNGNQNKPAPARILNLNEVKRPSERIRTAQPMQQPGSLNPAVRTERSQQPATSRPQINNSARPVQSGASNPANTNVRQQQPVAKPQNNNAGQPSQPRIATPAGNNARQQQPFSQPQNNNARQPSQPRAATPAGSNVRQQQPFAKPQNNNVGQPTQQRAVSPANTNVRQQQPNSTRPQNRNANEQSKESKPEKDK